MASYSKQQMEMAQEWLKVNPDPANPFLTIPFKNDSKIERHRAYLERVKKTKIPEALPLVDQLAGLIDEMEDAETDMGEAMYTMAKYVNQMPQISIMKGSIDHTYNADRGRWLLAWARQGYNVFDLSADFTAAMLLTDPIDINIKEVKLPFSSMLMLIPDQFVVGSEGSSYTKIHISEIPRGDVSQLDVLDKVEKTLDGLSPSAVTRVMNSVQEKLDKAQGSGDTAHVLFDTETGAAEVSTSKSLITPKVDPTDTVIHIYASDGVHSLATTIERQDLWWGAFDKLPSNIEADADEDAAHKLRRLVFGALAYMSAVDRAVVLADGPARKKPKARPTDEPQLRRHEVGRDIKIDMRLIQVARSGSREIAFQIKSRFIVRGHYRNQAHGPRRSERTRIWITPFWKGPEEGAKLVHTYKLDEQT